MPLTKKHPRSYQAYQYVYPVISRRSGGVSVGINLCPHCNFSCIYCQVLADSPGGASPRSEVDLPLLDQELRELLSQVLDGSLFENPWFAKTPPEKRRLSDIAFSGDGEPTLSPVFPEAIRLALAARNAICPPETKVVLITNATSFHVKRIADSVEFLLQNGGEVWAKLDAGTEEHYRAMSRSAIPFEKVMQNITAMSIRRPVVIQSLFLSLNGIGPAESELESYTQRLRDILQAGGSVSKVQIYTTARNTPDPNIFPLSNIQVDQIADRVRKATGLTVEPYYSS